MKISLVIPAYNEEKYIGDCLEYALRNNFFEIIVINNASTDATAEVAGRYPGVRVVHESKKGLTQARQRGFLEATGDIIAYTDADTHMDPNWAEKIAVAFSKNDKLACLSGPYIYYDIPFWQSILVWLYWHVLGLPIYLIIGYMTIGGNFAIRKSVLDQMHGFDTNISFYGEDTNIARRAHEFGKVKFQPSFTMKTSGRRFKGQGLFKTSILYMANFVSEVVLHKPVTGSYKDIR